MSFENEFDKIIKQKVQQQEIPFDENNWLKAEQMIDSQRNLNVKQGSSLLFKSLAFLAALGVVTGSYYLLTPKNDHQQVISNTAINSSADSKNSQLALASDFSSSQNLEIEKAPSNLNQEHAMPHSNELTPNQNNDKHFDRSTKTNQVQYSINKNQSFTKPVLNVTSDPAALASLPVQAKQTTNASNEEANQHANQTSSNVPTEHLTSANETSQKGGLSDSYNQTKEVKENTNSANNDASANQSTQMNTSNSTQNVMDELRVEYLEQVKLPTLNTDTAIIEKPIFLPSSYASNFSKPDKLKKHFLSVGAGINYTSGWSAPKGNDGMGLNYYGGFNYGFYVSRRLILGAGLDYYNIQNINQAFYTSQKTEYSFGSNYTYTSVVANHLKFLAIPIKLYVDINHSNILSLGVLPSILVGSKNTVESYQLVEGQKVNVTSSTNNVLYHGVAQKNMQVSLGYKLKLSGRVCLLAEALYGLTDLFENSVSNTFKQNPLGLRLGMQFNLIDK